MGNAVEKAGIETGIVERSGQDRFHKLARHVGKAGVAALEAIGQAVVVNSELTQQRGVQVVHVDWIDDRLFAIGIEPPTYFAGSLTPILCKSAFGRERCPGPPEARSHWLPRTKPLRG